MNFTIETLSIIITILSIVIGFLGIKYTLKTKKETGIIFFKNLNISLFQKIVKNLDNLEINFNGQKINDNLILFQGTFFNSGNIDIDKEHIYHPLEISIPKDYLWVKHKVIKSSKGLEIIERLENNKLIFNWNLFKEGEFFTIEGLIEYNSKENSEEKIEEKLFKKIRFDHRIKNLKEVRVEKSIPESKSIWFSIVTGTIFSLLFFLFTYSQMEKIVFPKDVLLNEIKINSKDKFYQVSILESDKVKITNLEDDTSKIISFEKFQNALGDEVKIYRTKMNYFLLIIFGLIYILFLLFCFWVVYTSLKEKLVYNKIKNVKNDFFI